MKEETIKQYNGYFNAHREILTNPDVTVSEKFLDKELDDVPWSGYGNNNLFFAILTILDIYGLIEGRNTREDDSFYWLIGKIQENIGESNKALNKLIEREKELFKKNKSNGENLYKQVLPIIGKIFGIRFYVMTGESAQNNRKWETFTIPERDVELKGVGFLRLKQSLFNILIPPVLQTQMSNKNEKSNRNTKDNILIKKLDAIVVQQLREILENYKQASSSIVNKNIKQVNSSSGSIPLGSRSLGGDLQVSSPQFPQDTGMFFSYFPFPKSTRLLATSPPTAAVASSTANSIVAPAAPAATTRSIANSISIVDPADPSTPATGNRKTIIDKNLINKLFGV